MVLHSVIRCLYGVVIIHFSHFWINVQDPHTICIYTHMYINFRYQRNRDALEVYTES
ncbi:hypothetical protein Hanom_Chr07g00627031 [Helianthus anomalus]